VGPSVRPGKVRIKGPGSILVPKGVGTARAQLGSAWLHGSAWPAAQKAGSVLGLGR
jgi:hypothetical protein